MKKRDIFNVEFGDKTGAELRRFNAAGLGPRPVRSGRARTLYLDDATIERAKALGCGSASDGIRKAIKGFKP